MQNDIVLSVAVITYNQEKYIAQTLDSILQQKHNYSYEIVIGDDCSKDKTREIIAEYQKKYPEIIMPIYNTSNLGLIKNYYNVIENCNGKYIMECAGDDYWLPGKVEKQILFMEDNSNISFCYGKGRILLNDKMTNKFWGKSVNTYKELILGEMNIPMASSCFLRCVMNRYIEEIDPVSRTWFSEDYPFAIWITQNYKIQYFDIPFYVYRVMKNTLSRTKSIDTKLKNIYQDYEMKKYFLEMNNENSCIPYIYEECINSQIYIAAKFCNKEKMIQILDNFSPISKKMKIKTFLLRNNFFFYCYFLYICLHKNIWC